MKNGTDPLKADVLKIDSPNSPIILDGVIKSAPVLRGTLSTGGIIEGFENNAAERDAVVSVLNSRWFGGLKGPVVEAWHGAGTSKSAAEPSASGPSR